MTLDVAWADRWARLSAERIAEAKDELTELDRQIGDGDHGLNMQRGFTKVAEKLPAVADKDIGQVLKTTGMTLLSSVGGASGPLYGTFFIRAAASSDACQSLTLGQLGKMLGDGVEGIVSRGRAEPGDKTMCDAWWPALAALQQAEQQGLPLPEALDKAVAALDSGIHLLMVDVHPPGPRDPDGIHGVLMGEIGTEEYALARERPLTAAAYRAGPVVEAFVTPFAVGEAIPTMPLFLTRENYVEVPLEATYSAAWQDVPPQYKQTLTA